MSRYARRQTQTASLKRRCDLVRYETSLPRRRGTKHIFAALPIASITAKFCCRIRYVQDGAESDRQTSAKNVHHEADKRFGLTAILTVVRSRSSRAIP